MYRRSNTKSFREVGPCILLTGRIIDCLQRPRTPTGQYGQLAHTLPHLRDVRYAGWAPKFIYFAHNGAAECMDRKEAQARRGILNLRYPIQQGFITNWESTEDLWRHLYANDLHCSSRERPVVVTEPVDNPIETRLKTLQVLFDHFDVPAVYLKNTAVLALYATGRSTGIVVDLGHEFTTCVAISNGKTLPQTARKTMVAGRALKDYFILTMMERGVLWTTTMEQERATEIMEQVCYVALDPDQENV